MTTAQDLLSQYGAGSDSSAQPLSAQSPLNASTSDWLAAYPPARSLPLDPDALRTFEDAYNIGRLVEGDGPRITFTTLMAALLESDDATSRWFRKQSTIHGPNSDAVKVEKGIGTHLTRGDWRRAVENPPHLSADHQLLTVSARRVLLNAEGWAQRVGGTEIGTRHLIASYLLNPPEDHRRQLKNWQVKEASWRKLFFEWTEKNFAFEAWADASRGLAPTRAVPTFVQHGFKGEALDWPGTEQAMKVLDLAANYHASRKDRWLRLPTTVFALLELAREDSNVGDEVRPLLLALEKVDAHYQEAREQYQLTKASGFLPFAKLDISPRMLNTLETARELAATSTRRRAHDIDGEVRVGAIHLAGALLSRRVDADAELARVGLDPRTLRVELVRYAETKGESEDAWREMLGEEEGPSSTARAVELSSDEPAAAVRFDRDWKSDPLFIRPDVEAFAALLASPKLQPPLSIGVFGPWGSGKTTFLERLQAAVDGRTKNVVHVKFNAWHFTEGALVSSLVDAILRAIDDFTTEKKSDVGKERFEGSLAALKSTELKVAAAKAAHASASAAVAAAEATLVVRRESAADNAVSLDTALKAAWNAIAGQLGSSQEVQGVLQAISATTTSATDLRQRAEAIRTRPARLLSDLGWGGTLFFAALVLVLPPAAGWLVARILGTEQVGQLLSSTSAFVAVLGVWLKKANDAATKVDQALKKVVDAYQDEIAKNPDVLKATQDLRSAEAAAETAVANLNAVRADLARAQSDLASATLPAQMAELVSGRIESRDYSKELTSLSLARADLERLSLILRGQRELSEAGSPPDAAATPPRAVDRVILYVDDLDRCRPADVVRVLEIVHMLLAFELFAVVVAVDSRWVQAALKTSYPWLAAGSEQAKLLGGDYITPQDYLEKIFQITFWLEPMTAPRAAEYLRSLARLGTREGETAATPATTIDITTLELDYLRALAAHVGPSPRRVKRLVNTYRMIKARLSDSQLGVFLTDRDAEDGTPSSGQYQIVIALLVIATGAQSRAEDVIRDLCECDPINKVSELVASFRAKKDRDFTMAAQVLEALTRTQDAKHASELRGWARRVRRYLLHRAAA